MVKAEGVHKSFGPSRCSRASTWRSRRGEVFCIVGPSGSGKSTFLRCINHLEKINAGRLCVDGAPGRLPAAGRQALRAAGPRGRRAAPRHRHGVPALQPLPAHDGAGERHGGAGPGQAARRKATARERALRPARPRRPRPTRRTPTPRSSPAASSSASRSPARWRWTPS